MNVPLDKGRNDNHTIANISLGIKFSSVYSASMPVYPEYGMQLVAAYLIEVRIEIQKI